MEKEKYGALIERGRVKTAEGGRYRVESVSREGITTPPMMALMPNVVYQVDELVYFFLFPDGDGLILTSATSAGGGTAGVTAQAKSVTPMVDPQTVLPDEGFDYLSQVTVDGIPYSESLNSAGGITVTIGGGLRRPNTVERGTYG